MGNHPSSEDYGGSPFIPPPPADRPLPPLPPPLSTLSAHASRTSRTSRASRTSRISHATRDSHTSSSAHKLAKPQSRPTAGLLKSSDGFAKGTGSRRFSSSGIAHLVASSFSSPSSPTSSSFAVHTSSRPLPPPPPPLLPVSPETRSPSVFTFEEAVAAVTGQRDPAAWRPVSSAYPPPSLDLELLQEEQARELEFQRRERQIQIQHRQLQLEAQKLIQERQLRQYSSVNFEFYDQPDTDTEREDDIPFERVPRGRQQQKQKPKSRRSSFFRSKSSQRPESDHNDLDDRNYRDYRRRNSIGSVYSITGDRHTRDNGSMTYDQVLDQYYGGPLSENWPPPPASRSSWNYDMTSYAAKRLLHIVDDGPLDHRFEQVSAASERRYSMLSEVTWKNSHPVRPESPTLTRANSDLSLYAPVRRTSIIQVPGVATRRNSTSSFTSAGGTSMRPNFRHSVPATTPNLSRRNSFESTGSRVQSMPPVLQRPELSGESAAEPTPRVLTPTEGEYNAIGAFKLGSLRITNGSDSPVSSPERKRAQKTDAANEEPAHSPGFDIAERTRALAALSANETSQNKVDAYVSTLEVHDTNQQGTSNPIGNRQISQLSPALFQPPVELFAGMVAPATAVYELPAREPVVSPAELPSLELLGDLFAGFEFSSFTLEEAASSDPPSVQPTATPATLQTTSKATALEDLLFEEDDHSTFEHADAEILDVRLDPNAKPVPKRGKAGILAARKSAHSIQSVSRSDSGFVSSPTSESSHKPLSKADSGYSSNVSLRSFKQAASKLINQGSKAANRLSAEKDSSTRAPERQSFIIDELKLPSPTINTPEMGFQPMSPVIPLPITRKPVPFSVSRPPPPNREAPPPPPPGAQVLSPGNLPKDVLPPSPVSATMTDTSTPATSESAVPGLLGGSSVPTKKRHAVPSPLDTFPVAPHSDSQPSPTTSPIPLTPASVVSNGSASALSIGSGTQRPSKLLRFLNFANGAMNGGPTNKGPPAVHVTHIEDDEEADIPSVPHTVNDKLREHTGLFPITTKRLALKTQMSRDTLRTIFSVGSLETHSSSDLHSNALASSAVKDEASHRRYTFQAPSSLVAAAAAAVMPLKAVTKRKSRLSMTVEFSDDLEVDEVLEIQQHDASTDTILPDPCEESKTKRGRMTWLRWGREGERQTPSPEIASDDEIDRAVFRPSDQEMGIDSYDDTALATDGHRRSHSRSSSIIGRTMSLTAQLERTLSMKITFPKLTRPSTSERGSTNPMIPISAFSTAFNSQPLSPSLPSPLFAEAMAQQRRAMTPEAIAAASPPVSARMQQFRPSMLRVPPPLRPQSTPPNEAGSRRVSRQNSQDSLYNGTSAQYYQATGQPSLAYSDVGLIASGMVDSPPRLDSSLHQTHPNWEIEADHNSSSGLASQGRRESLDYSFEPQMSFSGNDAHLAFLASGGAGGQKHYKIDGDSSQEDRRTRVLRHRASYDGYSNGPQQPWDGGGHTAPQHNPPSMSNGYTGQVTNPFGSGRRRSGSSSSGHSDIYQLQQQQAWDFYYQQYARPPPNVPRGSHHRNRSMGSRHGPLPGPQAPYRILHSYNSPAYRGVPIWG